METQKYTVPVTISKTRMVPVTKKVPKTIYVDVTTQVPQNYTTTTMQTRERQVFVLSSMKNSLREVIAHL